MMKLLTLASLLPFLGSSVLGCDDHAHAHDHAHEKRAIPSVQLAPPTRPLDWSDINIIHTTDSHGWLLGHQKTSFPEPNYSGDLGDFASFVSHMKQIALEKDVDLLLVDSGDLHDGTGLSDGFPPGGVDAHESNKFLAKLPYDIMAIGNHELYIYNNTLDMYKNFAPHLNGRYLSSNVNITVPDKHGVNQSVPVGSRFAKFKTRKGRKVTSVGVLYDFTDNDEGTTVQKVSDMVKEQWFAEAIEEEPDFFLLVGHMPVQRDDWPLVFNAVRAVHPTTPILILGGHTHIRDCVQLDGRSMSLESGRYMETVGFLSAKLDQKGSKKNLTFSRRYLDPNRVTYEFHAQTKSFNFDTALGESITKGLNQLAVTFDLNMTFGTAPNDFTISRSPFPSNTSLLTLYAAEKRAVQEELERREKEAYGRGYVDKVYREWLREMNGRWGVERRAAQNLTLGYVTQDACPGIGDDILHAPLPFFSTPDFIASNAPNVTDDTPIDLVFVDFIEDQLLGILNAVQTNQTFTEADVQSYTDVLASAVLGLFAEKAWN
ncbi:hypothetical protein EUX98_g4639 [Antrodiella citrinella]|uniref:Putative 5'-nucleotidase C-terminal domain-containing protein n=1 Tax=Antrodiella citrinella TaxID=2447956 RepID=A0A4S4N1G7_9APHY|nr:hypothetical protein EUX98_g4639 [Antrodiella citrinella]